jgi:hypothetical protein
MVLRQENGEGVAVLCSVIFAAVGKKFGVRNADSVVTPAA